MCVRAAIFKRVLLAFPGHDLAVHGHSQHGEGIRVNICVHGDFGLML